MPEKAAISDENRGFFRVFAEKECKHSVNVPPKGFKSGAVMLYTGCNY
jgi:hypothetical protein